MSLMTHVCGRANSSPKSERISDSGVQPRAKGGNHKPTKPSAKDEAARVADIDNAKNVINGPTMESGVGPAGRGPEIVNESIGAPNSRRGRPRIGETRDKPWLSCEPPMSERTWRRRLSEQRSKEGGK